MYFRIIGCVIYFWAKDTAQIIKNVFTTKATKQNKSVFFLVSKECTIKVFKRQTRVGYNNVIINPPYLNRFLDLPYLI